jgi:hypothetical protein
MAERKYCSLLSWKMTSTDVTANTTLLILKVLGLGRSFTRCLENQSERISPVRVTQAGF